MFNTGSFPHMKPKGEKKKLKSATSKITIEIKHRKWVKNKIDF